MAKQSAHWSRVGEAGTVMGMRILLLVYRVFGRIGFKVLLFPVMSYFYLFKREARAASIEYLARIKPYLSADQQRKLGSFKHFIYFGDVLMDKFLVWMGRITKEDVVFETPETIQEVDYGQRGGIIVVSHLGNTEVCNALANKIPDLRLTILVYTQHAEKFNSLMKHFHRSKNVQLLQVTEMTPATAILLSERVDNGEYVIIAGDRTPVTGAERTSLVDFLGAKALMPQGAFILAGLLKCPVYLLFCIKQRDQYHIYLEHFKERVALPRKERQSALDKVVQEYALRLESYCIKAPLQWFNFYSFWNTK